MTRTLLIRGLLVGLAAGLAAFLVARLVGETAVSQAIALESGQVAGHAGHAAEQLADAGGASTAGTEPVSRAIQSTIGLLVATLAYGLVLGGIFALVFAASQGRLGRFGPRPLAGLLALGGFLTISVLPFLKYPANPPAVGDPETIDRRTGLYFVLVTIGLLLAYLAVLAGRRLTPRLGTWNAAIAGSLVFAVTATVALRLLPGVDEVGDFPAGLLWEFRLASLGVQLAAWATLGLLFGALTERALRNASPPATA
jgi:hypothetical protein